jgi:hypothetical protein
MGGGEVKLMRDSEKGDVVWENWFFSLDLSNLSSYRLKNLSKTL